MDEVEFEVLDTLYFVEPYEKILEECRQYAEPVIKDALRQLIRKRWVVAMRYDEEKRDFVRSFIYDADDMHAYHYLATKEGLLAHNGHLGNT